MLVTKIDRFQLVGTVVNGEAAVIDIVFETVLHDPFLITDQDETAEIHAEGAVQSLQDAYFVWHDKRYVHDIHRDYHTRQGARMMAVFDDGLFLFQPDRLQISVSE
jgi:hypothetical protein